jgi:hypothetical protein
MVHTKTYFLITQLKSSKDGQARYFLAYESFSAGNILVYLTRHKATFSEKGKAERAPRGKSKQWRHGKTFHLTKKGNENIFLLRPSARKASHKNVTALSTHSQKKAFIFYFVCFTLPNSHFQ